MALTVMSEHTVSRLSPPCSSRPDKRRRKLGLTAAVSMAVLAMTVHRNTAAETQSEQAAAPVEQEAFAAAPEGSGRYLSLPGLGRPELAELISVVVTRLKLEFGYAEVEPHEIGAWVSTDILPRSHEPVLIRSVDGQPRLLQLTFRVYRGQAPGMVLFGVSAGPEGKLQPNPDLPQARQFVEEAKTDHETRLKDAETRDLTTRRIRLSYIDPARCLQMLNTYGVTTATAGKAVDPKALPVVLPVPGTKQYDLPVGASKNFPMTETDPLNELLVFYHPARPGQFSHVQELVETHIDVPAMQIMIEAMVLEISQTELQQLGVEWRLANSRGGNFFNEKIKGDLIIGRIVPETLNQNAQLDVNFTNIFREFNTRLQALVREGRAKILSRPSVLTLDNRMAYINVARRIPIAQSKFHGNQNISTVNFRDVTAGIQLNVRPRVSSDGEEISMQVVASVTARVPDEDVVIRNDQGTELARAPTISEREVRTFTRISNNTPFIIGGLVAQDDISEEHKVPLLGDIPYVGSLFRSRDSEGLKREVIIVITPFVLPEAQVVHRNLPKDEDAFDSFGNELFRDAYRIRGEDVFDLNFLTQNRRLQRMQKIAERVVARNHRLRNVYPFSRFSGDRIPGERILVYRQIYEVLKRKQIDKPIRDDGMIFFKPNESSSSGFSVRFLWDYLRSKAAEMLATETTPSPDLPEDPFKVLQQHDKVLALIYTFRRESDEARDILMEPVPEIRLLDCPDGDTWNRLLWEYNQPATPGGPRRHTILLRERDNLLRVKLALLVKKTVQLNASESALTLENFSLGRLLLLPTVKQEDVFLVDGDVAKYFFYTEQYYQALQKILQTDMQALRETLQKPEYADYSLDGPRKDSPQRPPSPVKQE